MMLTSRRSALAVAGAAAVAVAAPSFAATHLQPTSLNLRASKTVVKAHHTTTFTATLTTKGQPLDGQAVAIEERTVLPSGHKTSWTTKGTATGTGNGHYTFTVTPDITPGHHTQKDQFRAVFDKTSAYASSKSQIITVTVKRASS